MVTKIITIVIERFPGSALEPGLLIEGYDKKQRKFKNVYSEEMILIPKPYCYHETKSIEVEVKNMVTTVRVRRPDECKKLVTDKE